jgi:TonB family protein
MFVTDPTDHVKGFYAGALDMGAVMDCRWFMTFAADVQTTLESGASSGEEPLSPARSMLGSSRRMGVRVHRRETLGGLVWLSLALHLTLLLTLLMLPPTQPSTSGSEPLTVDLIMGEGPAEATPEPPAPPETTVAPIAPVQQAEIPPPTPTSVPMPVPPPPAPVAQVQPPRALPQRVAARTPVHPAGTPAHAPAGQNAAGAASDGKNGAAWMGKLKQWWDQHSYYPKEASQTNEGGNVKVHIVIAPDGQVTSIDVVQGSGLSVLDAAAVAVFRNAHLPPFPPGTPAQPADVVVTLHYRPADSGG